MELPPITNDNIKDLVKNREKYRLPIGEWDVSNVTDMTELFSEDFNEDISNWDVSNVTNMSGMFLVTSAFNQPLNSWNVSKVTNMDSMFRYSVFNQPLDNWDVSNVTNMAYMFSDTSEFNQPLNSWNVSNVTTMESMFQSAVSFNQPLNNWDVCHVIDMSLMFLSATSFNQSLNSWDISNVKNMGSMFEDAASFDQPLNNWNISPDIKTYDMFLDCPIRQQNLPNIYSTTFNTNEKCYDIIMGEEIPINEYIKDRTNMVFVFYDEDIIKSQKVCIKIDEFKKAMGEKQHYIIYGCKIVNTMRPDNIDTINRYFDIKKLCGFGDVVRLENMDTIVQNMSANKIIVFKKSNEKLVTTVSDDVLNNRTSYVSARHCQEGQSADVYVLVQNVTFVDEAIGGRKQIRQRTEKSNKTKKINKIKKRKNTRRKRKSIKRNREKINK